jgi:hypothetical protein
MCKCFGNMYTVLWLRFFFLPWLRFFRVFSSIVRQMSGKTRKDGARFALLHISCYFVLFSCYLCCSMYCLCVNVYCHRVTTQLQLINISYQLRMTNLSYSPPQTSHGAMAPSGPQALLIIPKLFRSHSGTPHSVGLLWKSEQPDPENSPWQHTKTVREKHQCFGGIRTHNPRKQEAADSLLRPRGHWDRRLTFSCINPVNFALHSTSTKSIIEAEKFRMLLAICNTIVFWLSVSINLTFIFQLTNQKLKD